MASSASKQVFVEAVQKLIPEIRAEQIEAGGAGIRAQACDRQGNLLDDFDIRKDGNLIHVFNLRHLPQQHHWLLAKKFR